MIWINNLKDTWMHYGIVDIPSKIKIEKGVFL